MKVAIIGCGTIANNAHIPSYMNNAKAEIKYFCDIIPERAQAAVESGFGVHPEQCPRAHRHRLPAGGEKRAVREAGGPHLCGSAEDAEGAA